MFKKSISLLSEKMLKALNVAEKPSVARTITQILSNNSFRLLKSDSKYNQVFQFNHNYNNEEYIFQVTSARGHIMHYETPEKYNKWNMNDLQDIFTTNLEKSIRKDCIGIKNNLEKFGRDIDLLILWLDYDREGENICFEVIDIVKKVNPNIKILRAQFSALTKKDIIEAIKNLKLPNKNISDAVDIRMRIDLIIGSTFTRMQTLTFNELLGIKNGILSYGPCQFPTLNFIMERSDKIENFESEKYHTLDLIVIKDNTLIKFNWERDRLFDETIVKTLYEKVSEFKQAKVINITSEKVTKKRPFPLNTVEYQKIVSRKLKITSDVSMSIADKLYQLGYISYPRTETQKFSQNLKYFVENLGKEDFYPFCKFARELKNIKPRIGPKDDKSHPPIHPVKLVDPQKLSVLDRKVYEFICCHFLACISSDAEGNETVITLEINEEKFKKKCFKITEKGFLDVYQYDTWQETDIINFREGEIIDIGKIHMEESQTQKPNLLTESELISLMDRYGIGTDATIHDHIKNVKDRKYAVQFGSVLKPTLIGKALLKTYSHIGIEIYKPYLRAAMERDIKLVCNGEKDANETFIEMRNEMKNIFDNVLKRIETMKDFLIKYIQNNKENSKPLRYEEKTEDIDKGKISEINNNPEDEEMIINKNKIPATCNKCNSPLQILFNKYKSLFIGCSGFPKCSNMVSLNYAKTIYNTKSKCSGCQSPIYKIMSKKEYYEDCLSECFMKNNYKLKDPINKKLSQKNLKSKKSENLEVENNKSNITKRKTKTNNSEKVCSVCGTVGRHSKNSGCPGVKKKTNSDKQEQFIV